VKKFPPARTPHETKSVHREIGVMYLASTRCHHCARCWGYVQESDGSLLLVMHRYAQSLNTKLRNAPGGRLGLADVQRYGRKIARAGMELHSQNVVLSDLKPANILLSEYDEIAVADFGISTLLKRDEEQDDGLHGTFNYMSPEAFDPESFGRLSTMSDIWSFACCIVEMVSGQRPWSGTQMSAICFKITAAREIPQIPTELPLAVRNLLQACFAYDSSTRPTFQDVHRVFSQPWGEVGVVRDATENAELLRLRHEEARWDVQRKELICKVRRDACLVADMQKNVVEHQEVNEKLQEQLVLLVNSLKQQRLQPSIATANAPDPVRYAAQLELQLAGCQDALKQCMRQKDVAKEMLRRESTRTRQLAEQVDQLHETQDRMQDTALHLAVQSKIAEEEVAKMYSDVAAQDKASSLPGTRYTDRMSRVRQPGKTHGHFTHSAAGGPSARGLYGSDGTEVDSVRESRESSSSTEGDLLKRSRELTIGSRFDSLALLSQASTPSPMVNDSNTPTVFSQPVSAQNSWDSKAPTVFSQPVSAQNSWDSKEVANLKALEQRGFA